MTVEWKHCASDVWSLHLAPGHGAVVTLMKGHVERPDYWLVIVKRSGESMENFAAGSRVAALRLAEQLLGLKDKG